MSNVLARMAFDHDLRAEQIIHMGTMCATDPMADVAEEAFSSDWDEILQVLGIKASPDIEMEELSHLLMIKNLYGFLMQIGTPVPLHFHDNNSYTTGGFGIYATKWFYGESIDEIYTQATKWQTEYIEKKRKQALSKEATSC